MWILVLEGRMHDEPARRDVTTQGKRGAAAHHHVMSTDVERLMEVMCGAESMTIRARPKATTVVAVAATARGARTLARNPQLAFGASAWRCPVRGKRNRAQRWMGLGG
jgi:precorrin-6B methylase 2